MEEQFVQHILSVQREKSIPLAERIGNQISQLIIERDLQPDDRLPNEFELAEYMNVSRGTIREAIKLLASRNIVEIRRGKGTFVCVQTGLVDDPLGFAYMNDKTRLAREVLEVRQHLEPWIAAQAAIHATEEDIARLYEACLAVENTLNAKEQHLQEDKEFHTCIAECTHNRVIPKLIPIILHSVDLFGSLYIEQKEDVLDDEALKEAREMTIKTHRRIFNAIREHNATDAQIASYEHLVGNREQVELLEKRMKEQG